METITKATKWVDKNTKEIRFYITTNLHSYTRFVTGNKWNPAKSWGTDNGAQGQPSAEVAAEYKAVTENGKRSYYADQHTTQNDDEYQRAETQRDSDSIKARLASSRTIEM